MTTHVAAEERAARRAAAPARRSTMESTALLRNIVEGSDSAATTLLILVDSVTLAGSGIPVPSESDRRRLQGRALRVRVTPHGRMTLLDDAAESTLAAATLAGTPAVLPAAPVTVGESWQREIVIPLAEGGRGALRVDALFTLDSVPRGGELAYVSMRGVVLRDTTPELPPGVHRVMSGTVKGWLAVDRRRAWISDSWTLIAVRSLVTNAGAPERPPLRIDVKVTQRMRVVGGDGR
jgi:hypothetical protein